MKTATQRLVPNRRRVSLASAGAVVAIAFWQTPAQAQQRTPTPGGSNQCAIYGDGFVAVQGSSSCVRIGGRVRLELNATNSARAYAPGGLPQQSFGANDAPGNGVNRAHMRLGATGAR